MCVHSKREAVDNLARYREKYKKVGMVVMTTLSGRFAVAWYVEDATDDKHVAQTIANMREWHPGLGLDMQYINAVRAKHGAPLYRADGTLPPPNLKSAEDDKAFSDFLDKIPPKVQVPLTDAEFTARAKALSVA